MTWGDRALACQPGRVCHLQGYLPGRLQSLDFCMRRPAALETLTSGVVKTGVVAGEVLNPRAVQSTGTPPASSPHGPPPPAPPP